MSQRINISLSPLKITAIYLVVAGLWIAFTDELLQSLVSDPQYLSTLQTYKGLFYVIITGAGLYWLIAQHDVQLGSKESELNKLIEELRSEKELTDKLFDRIPVLITIYDPELKEFEVNKEFEKVIGWTNKEVQAHDVNLLDECYPDKELQETVVEFMNNPGVGWKELPMQTKEGEEIPTSWTNIKLTDDTSVGIGIDMSEIKASQAKVRESQEMLKRTFESLKASVIILDMESRTIEECNKSTEEMFGYSRDELIGRSTRILHTSASQYMLFDEISKKKLFKDGVFETEFKMARKDGSEFFSHHTVSLVENDKGEVVKVVSVVRDIDEQKKYQRQLEERNEFIETTLNNLPIGVIVNKIDSGETTLMNKPLFDIYGWPEEVLKNEQTFYEKIFPDKGYREKITNQIQEDIASHDPQQMQWNGLKIQTGDGDQKIINVKNIPLYDQNLMISTVEDVTKQKTLEKELRKRQERLLRSQKIGQIGDWELNPKTNEISWSPTMFEIYERDPKLGPPTYEEIQPYYYGSSLNKHNEAIEGTIEKKESHDIDLQLKTDKGNKKFVRAIIIPKENNEGKVVKLVGIVQDITERKNQEEKLKQRNTFIETTLKNLPIGVAVNTIDDGKTTLMNDQFSEIYGWPKSTLKDVESFFEHVYQDADYRAQIKKQVMQDMESGDSDQMDWKSVQITTQKGEKKYVNNKAIPLYEQNLMISTVIDVTEQEKLAKELKMEKQRFELVAQTSSDIIWDLNFPEKELWWSEGFEEVLGYERKSLSENYRAWEKYVHPNDRSLVSQSSQKALDSNSDRWEEQYRIIKKDGTLAYIIDRAKIIRDEDGNAVRMVGAMDDITERKKAEQKLRESEEKYRHLFENNPQPMWIYNPDTLKFVEVNKAAVNHYGYTQEEFLDMALTDIRPAEDVEPLKTTVEKHKSKKSYFGEWKHLKKDGFLIHVEVYAANVQYKDETFRLALIHDITEQKRMQEKIIQSVIEGEDRERKRISHELHDGLGQYLVAASMNLQSVKSDIEKLTEKRQTQFETGLSLLKNALSETRSIAQNLMPKAIADYGLLAALKNLFKDFQKSSDIEFNFHHNCDTLYLKNQAEINIYRIFQEIISNAVRHADCSTVSAELQLKKDTLTISIIDDGIGIELDEAHQDKGLGLRSIKTRVRNLKGTLEIESEPGEGMRTTITIPIAHNLNSNNSDNG